jgi:hypothetical protein
VQDALEQENASLRLQCLELKLSAAERSVQYLIEDVSACKAKIEAMLKPCEGASTAALSSGSRVRSRGGYYLAGFGFVAGVAVGAGFCAAVLSHRRR